MASLKFPQSFRRSSSFLTAIAIRQMVKLKSDLQVSQSECRNLSMVYVDSHNYCQGGHVQSKFMLKCIQSRMEL
jgi:hypothetical protein